MNDYLIAKNLYDVYRSRKDWLFKDFGEWCQDKLPVQDFTFYKPNGDVAYRVKALTLEDARLQLETRLGKIKCELLKT